MAATLFAELEANCAQISAELRAMRRHFPEDAPAAREIKALVDRAIYVQAVFGSFVNEVSTGENALPRVRVSAGFPATSN